MNKVTRMLAMTGMAIAATATVAGGAASAAQAAPAKPSADASASKTTDRFGSTRVVGYYSNLFACHRVGNAGEWRNRWDDHNCVRVRFGLHRGAYALVAEWDRRGHWGHGFPGHGFPGGHGHGHGGHHRGR